MCGDARGQGRSATRITLLRIARSLTVVGLALTLAPDPAVAQGLRAGMKFGIDFANLAGSAENTRIKTGNSVGAFVGTDLGTVFRVGIDGQFVQKGAKADEIDIDELVFKLGYVELLAPVSAVAWTGGSFEPRFFAGPAVAFETSCKLAATIEGFEVERDCDDPDIGLKTGSVDFGMFFGAGADVSLGAGAIVFDVLYNLGLSDISNDAGAETSSLKNRNIQVTIGYAYSFSGS